jgi:hypothetical protein
MKKLVYLCCTFLLLFSCGNDNASDEEYNNTENTEATVEKESETDFSIFNGSYTEAEDESSILLFEAIDEMQFKFRMSTASADCMGYFPSMEENEFGRGKIDENNIGIYEKDGVKYSLTFDFDNQHIFVKEDGDVFQYHGASCTFNGTYVLAGENASNDTKEADFNVFWEDFVGQKGDAAFVKTQTLFPFYKGGFQNELIGEDDFYNIFQGSCDAGATEIKAVTEGSIIQFLEDSFIKDFGSLEGVYEVYCEPAPSGLKAYFVSDRDGFKLIGMEEIELAH